MSKFLDKIDSPQDLKNISIEKYGRILADIYLDVLHVNEYMIQHNYAYKYNGGKKQHFNEITT